MTIIDADDASNHLHEMWDAVLADGAVAFTRGGVQVATLRWSGSTEDRQHVIEELAETIGYSPRLV